LQVGDQIIRVNGFTVDDAVHKEVLQLISNHTHLTLKVRSEYRRRRLTRDEIRRL
jgi:C-terminal processing protease CtpA/Prc